MSARGGFDTSDAANAPEAQREMFNEFLFNCRRPVPGIVGVEGAILDGEVLEQRPCLMPLCADRAFPDSAFGRFGARSVTIRSLGWDTGVDCRVRLGSVSVQ